MLTGEPIGSLNPDLSSINGSQEAEKHYLEHGHRESRPFSFPMTVPTNGTDRHSIHPVHSVHSVHPIVIKNEIEMGTPSDFNWLEYRSLHPDLKHISTPQEAAQHYYQHGKREQRAYKVTSYQTPNRSAWEPMQLAVTSPKIQPSQIQSEVSPVNGGMSPRRHPRIVLTGPTSNDLIPNVIHFVYGFKRQTEPFELFKYIAIQSAIQVNHPDRVCFHYYYEPLPLVGFDQAQFDFGTGRLTTE